MRILLIEDDDKTVAYLRRGLAPEGHALSVAMDGCTGLIQAAEGGFDLLIIDRMLPGIDGLALLRTLRTSKIDTPALFLTALGSIDDRVTGLRAGGDDYLVKPFELAELEARICAVARRRHSPIKTTCLRVADLTLDRLSGEVTRGGRVIELTPKEFHLLSFLMLHEGQTVPRRLLLEKVWNYHYETRTSIVQTHISRLRDKIDTDGDRPLIRTVKRGYCMGLHD